MIAIADIREFFSRVGVRFLLLISLALSLACFGVPAVLGMRRAFSRQNYPTIQQEYWEWAVWLKYITKKLLSGEPLNVS